MLTSISIIISVGAGAFYLDDTKERKFNSETNIDLSKSKYYGKDIVQSESNELQD